MTQKPVKEQTFFCKRKEHSVKGSGGSIIMGAEKDETFSQRSIYYYYLVNELFFTRVNRP